MSTKLEFPIIARDSADRSTEQFFAGFPSGPHPDYFVDFHDFKTTQSGNDAFETVKDAGASAAIGADANLGTLVLSSTATTDNDGALVQGIQESYALTPGKKLWFEAKVQLSDADQMDFFAGLSEQAATDPENILAASNRAGFQINDGNASILCKAEIADVETSQDSEQDAADATYVKLGMHYDGADLYFYVNRTYVAKISAANLPTANMAIAMYHLSGDASGTKSSTWDYVMVVGER